MSKSKRCYSREFKLEVCEEVERTENVAELARALGLRRATLYLWRDRYLAQGSAGLRGRGRPATPLPEPPPAAPQPEAAAAQSAMVAALDPARRIAELERKIGQQALELDFFRAALQHVRALRRSSGGPGGTASTR
jgi:transposase